MNEGESQSGAEANGVGQSLARPVWDGDSVVIPRFDELGKWNVAVNVLFSTMIGLSFILLMPGVIRMFIRGSFNWDALAPVLVWTGVVAMFIVARLTMIRRAARSRIRALASEEATVPWLARLRACAGLANNRVFDTAGYLDASSGPRARVVTDAGELPWVGVPSDVTEEVQLRGSQPTKRIRYWLLSFFLLQTAALTVLVMFSGIWRIGHVALLGLILFAIMALPMFVPITAFAVAIASPGKVVTGGVLGSREFTRDDSVLLVLSSPGSTALMAIVVRRDGRWVWFVLQQGHKDPRLAELLGRWCYRPVRARPAVDGC